ncbi:unnamed protein product [Zymoseptoria tritici ST99CH_3D1]|nr:unnamed protein product [Zymoseptoria tritici ST99CH_3D1]
MEDPIDAPLLPGLPGINDVYQLYHDNKLEAFAEAADELLETRKDLVDIHRIQLKCLLISVTQVEDAEDFDDIDEMYTTARREYNRLKQLFRINGSDNPDHEGNLRIVERLVNNAQEVVQRRSNELFGPFGLVEDEVEEEEMMDMELDEAGDDEAGDDEDTIIADIEVPLPLPTPALALALASSGAHSDDLNMELSSEASMPVVSDGATDMTELSSDQTTVDERKSVDEMKPEDQVEPSASDALVIRPAPRKTSRFAGSIKLRHAQGKLGEKKSRADLRSLFSREGPEE